MLLLFGAGGAGVSGISFFDETSSLNSALVSTASMPAAVGGAFLDILFPDRDVPGLETNTASIVAKLTYGATSFLFTGDSPKSIEGYLAALEGPGLDSDVLKVGHHGSKTSTSDELLGLVSPSYAVISAGAGNRYGHPHAAVLDALSRFGVERLGTYERGTIIFKSNGTDVWLEK